MKTTKDNVKALLCAALYVGFWAALAPAGWEQLYRTFLQTGQTIQRKLF